MRRSSRSLTPVPITLPLLRLLVAVLASELAFVALVILVFVLVVT